MCFSSIWILTLPWLVRVKCHSIWSYFCLFIDACTRTLYSPVFYFCFCFFFLEIFLHYPSFRVKIALQKPPKWPLLSCIVLLFEKKNIVYIMSMIQVECNGFNVVSVNSTSVSSSLVLVPKCNLIFCKINFACLFSVHNTISLSCHEQVCLIRLRFER